MPMRLGVTDEVRPGKLASHFDDGTQNHLLSAYAECGLQQDVRWLGQPTGMAPPDLISVQDIICRVRPDAIIGVGIASGLIPIMDSVVHAAGLGCTRGAPRTRPRRRHRGRPTHHVARRDSRRRGDGERRAAWAASAETVLVLHAAGDETRFSNDTLHAWGELVSHTPT